ncbi:MAG: ABC transporter permease [Vicinamibacteria bacterium]|nr:ABC transporter permease [Vicinamibacteria bacterium]MBP9945941.1 ABC transporter permease [Vicinamibacteria bacterium]
MPFHEAIAIAMASVKANKLRSILTILGVVIGIASVIAVVAITDGLDRYMADKVLALGSKSFTVQKFPDIIVSFDQFREFNKRKDLTLRDVDLIRDSCTLCAEVGGLMATNRTVKYGSIKQESVQIMGVTENFSRIGSIRDLIVGRHLIDDDIDSARAVAVIGADLMDAFFPNTEPLGKEIIVDGNRLRVVGVGERKGKVFGESQDNFVWTSITAFRKLFGSRRSVSIQVEAQSMEVFEKAQDQARLALRNRRHLAYGEPDDFNIETGESVMDLWNSATQGIYVVTIVVTLISLLVGGVVVMNIMLVSVTERIKEIGVRKALGARRGDIQKQFIVESVLLTGAGGILGVMGAAIFSFVVGRLMSGIVGDEFSAPVRLWAVAVAVVSSTIVGLVAGIYPASRAAALDPVVALRSE